MSAGTLVWLVPIHPGAAPAAEAERLLSPAEVQRAQHLCGARRRSFVLSHAASRLILAAHHKIDPTRLRWEEGQHGKPGPVHGTPTGAWSLSHSGDWALVAVGGSSPIGVDVLETSLVKEPERLAQRFFPAEEARRVEQGSALARRTVCARLLSRREACIKAVGGTVAQSLKIAVHRTGVVDGPPDGASGSRLHLVDLPAPAGSVAALAAVNQPPTPVARRFWSWT